MANNYFKFKQFIVYQDKCSMKVCTDACILGAWAANMILKKQLKFYRCLDIGAGTGLLSLMLAQKTTAFIEAVELDENAFEQANDNFKKSRWSDRLQIFNSDAKYFSAKVKYDFIIANPPFYENSLQSPATANNLARHSDGLKLSGLITVVKNNLLHRGCFAVLLPQHRIDYFEGIAKENHFFLQEKILVKSTPGHDYFRGILLFSQTNNPPVINELIIKDNDTYTEGFVALMKDYYLNL